MKIKFCIIYTSFLTGILISQSPEIDASSKVTTAVIDFDGLGITAMEAVALTQRLSGEMVNTNAIILVDRSQMKEILQEQGFQQSGCTTTECAVEIGNLLGVQQMVSGSFGKIGSTYTIEAKMFSVETGQTMKAVNKTFKGEVDGLITQVELVAWELVDLEPPDELKEKAGIPLEKPKVAKSSSSGKKWLYTGLTAVSVGAIAYALSKKDPEKTLKDLSTPPDPPPAPKLLFGGRR